MTTKFKKRLISDFRERTEKMLTILSKYDDSELTEDFDARLLCADILNTTKHLYKAFDGNK